MIPDSAAPENPAEAGISIVIPSWNGRALLERYLPSVQRAAATFESGSGQSTEIVVADDASTDGTSAWLASHFPQVRVEPGTRRAGFAPTANRGVRAARYALVYLVNNDVALDAGALAPLVEHFTSGSAPVLAVSSQVYDYDTGRLSGAGQLGEFRRGFIGIHRRYFVSEPNSGGPWLTLFATGGSSMFDRRKFLELGGFDESFAPFGWEDVELSLRAWKQGSEVHYEPRSIAWHQFSSTIKPSHSRRYVRSIYERNRLLAHWYHLDTRAERTAHAASVIVKLLGALLSGHWELWRATMLALERWSQVRERRRRFAERRVATLRDVLKRVRGELGRPDARLLDAHAAPVRNRIASASS